MKLTKIVIAIGMVCSFQFSLAQEFETFFADRSGYTIDLPSNWATGLNEGKKGAQALISFNPNENHEYCLVLPGKEMLKDLRAYTQLHYKAVKSVVKKNSKKDDDEYEFGEIQKGEISGNNCHWFTYTQIMTLDNGQKLLIKYTDYIFKQKFNVYNVRVGGEEATYVEKRVIYDKIARSFRIIEK